LLSGERKDPLGSSTHEAAETIVNLLMALDVSGAIVEKPYQDPDFAAEYLAFHARQFRPSSKDCTRIHFFCVPSEDLDHIIAPEVEKERLRASKLAGLATYLQQPGTYRGFCVLRPTDDVPIGYTVIARPPVREIFDPTTRRFDRKLWAKYTARILGQEFTVFGFPFIEQDSRTGACAQAALWMVRYLSLTPSRRKIPTK
jgi:hypothetical protein